MTEQRAQTRSFRLSPRTLVALVILALVVVFILANREDTVVSFAFFSVRSPLWVALTVAALGGFAAGFLISRGRYR